jgi:hypothetical protein
MCRTWLNIMNSPILMAEWSLRPFRKYVRTSLKWHHFIYLFWCLILIVDVLQLLDPFVRAVQRGRIRSEL